MADALPDSPALVSAYLEGAGLGLTQGSNLFTSEEIPDAVTIPTVYVRAAGGPPPRPYFGASGSDHVLQLSILVRGSKDEDPEGFELARSISDALQKASISPFYSVLLRDAQPVSLGRDLHDQPGWSIGVEARFTS